MTAPPDGPFALLHRPGDGPGLDVLRGPVRHCARLADLGPDLDGDGRTRLVVLPYRQIAERGLACHDDHEPLLVMDVVERERTTVAEFVAGVEDTVPPLADVAPDVDDEDYAAMVDRVVGHEIHRGTGANVVLSRSVRGRFTAFSPAVARAVFARLLTGESGAYWTFLVHTGDRYLIGSTPEQHARLDGTALSMTPISGTYRYPDGGPERAGVAEFLADAKETDELFMVVDEELKMMAALCDRDVAVSGPQLRPMSRLAHTEYRLSGWCDRPLAEVLRTTMFAPTVTGSPLASACRVIHAHERGGRGYYSGALALVGPGRSLDSAITIRAVDVAADGRFRLTTGATVVRDSVGHAEAAETTAKCTAVLGAMTGAGPPGGAGGAAAPLVAAAGALHARNDGLSSFWRDGPGVAGRGGIEGVRVAIVDGEDAFTAMLAYQLRALGAVVRLVPWTRAAGAGGIGGPDDLVLLGPGPGDPGDGADPRVAALRALAATLLASGRPLAGVCLGHQVVCAGLGLPLVRLAAPNQGRRMPVRLHGRRHVVGFYNSFAARTHRARFTAAGRRVAVAVDAAGDVVGLRGDRLATLQFHAESFLTDDGPTLLRGLVTDALAPVLPDRRGEEAVRVRIP